MLDHYHEGVRKAAVVCLLNYLTTFYSLSNPHPWECGLSVKTTVDSQVEKLMQCVIGSVLKMADEEDDQSVMTVLFEEIALCIKTLGPFLLQTYLDTLCSQCLKVLKKEHFSQEEVNEDETDEYLISGCVDVVGAMAFVCGEEFIQCYKVFHPVMMVYATSTNNTDRNTAIGGIAEVTVGLKNKITFFAKDSLSPIIKGLSDEDESIVSNSCFAIGNLIFYSDLDFSEVYPSILNALSPLFSVQSNSNLVDNACGAIARLILKQPQKVPLDAIVPVLLQNLPLKVDQDENEPIFACLLFLLQHNHPVALHNKSTIQSLAHTVLSMGKESKLTQTTMEQLKRI